MGDKVDKAIKHFAVIIKEIGLTGFVVTVLVAIFLFYSSAEQKEEFIDKYILLNSDSNFYCIAAILFLVLVMFFGGAYQNKMLKMRKNENNRIAQEKTDLQKILLERQLNSSK